MQAENQLSRAENVINASNAAEPDAQCECGEKKRERAMSCGPNSGTAHSSQGIQTYLVDKT